MPLLSSACRLCMLIPFDRLMLAQAVMENMQFVTYDRLLSRYDIAILTWS